MPELPEVETIKRGLDNKVVNLTVKNIQILNPKTFSGNVEKTKGPKITDVWRRAKMLGIELKLSGPVTHQPHDLPTTLTSVGPHHGAPRLVPPVITLLFHLKMTGQLIFVEKGEQHRIIGGHPTPDMKGDLPNKSTRVIFEFSNGSKLYFNDQRKFGWVKLLEGDKQQIMNDKLFKNLGPEPLEKDFNWEVLKNNLLRHKSMPIKVALMDQTVVSGIGNIYASESLFDARIDPRRKVSTLTDEEFKKLVLGIQKALKVSIEKGGSTRAHFVDVEGNKGYFLDYANVYGKEGYKCNGCSGKVQKIQQAGRGTYLCPLCQK